jgi:hypothetical protein
MSKDKEDRVFDKQSEDRYWELEKGRDELNKKVTRIEQARRNVEALGKMLGYQSNPDVCVDWKLFHDTLSSNMKIMNEVDTLK